MNLNPKVSVIIPVFNTEKYIKRCIESIESQTYNNIELILINDVSTDKSLDIIKSFQDLYDNIILINLKEKSGVSIARNEGIKKASGHFIMFVDSDDYLENTCIEKCVRVALKKKSDIVCFGNIEVFQEKKKKSLKIKRIYAHTVWGKLFSLNFITKHKLKFLPNYWIGEDSIFCLETLLYNPKISYLNEALYNYLKYSENSLTKQPIDKVKSENYKTLIYMLRLKPSFIYYNIFIRRISEIYRSIFDKKFAPLKEITKNDNINYIFIIGLVFRIFLIWVFAVRNKKLNDNNSIKVITLLGKDFEIRK